VQHEDEYDDPYDPHVVFHSTYDYASSPILSVHGCSSVSWVPPGASREEEEEEEEENGGFGGGRQRHPEGHGGGGLSSSYVYITTRPYPQLVMQTVDVHIEEDASRKTSLGRRRRRRRHCRSSIGMDLQQGGSTVTCSVRIQDAQRMSSHKDASCTILIGYKKGEMQLYQKTRVGSADPSHSHGGPVNAAWHRIETFQMMEDALDLSCLATWDNPCWMSSTSSYHDVLFGTSRGHIGKMSMESGRTTHSIHESHAIYDVSFLGNENQVVTIGASPLGQMKIYDLSLPPAATCVQHFEEYVYR